MGRASAHARRVPTNTNAAPPAPAELDALLRLLDDETPAVRARVAERLALCGGDISEWLATQPRILTREEKSLLSEMLSPARRENLVRDWIAPTGGSKRCSGFYPTSCMTASPCASRWWMRSIC